MLRQQCQFYLYNAEKHDDFLYRKGFLDGAERACNLINVLLSLGEIGDEQWLTRELQEQLGSLRGLLLQQDSRQPQEEATDRVSRVMKAVLEARQER